MSLGMIAFQLVSFTGTLMYMNLESVMNSPFLKKYGDIKESRGLMDPSRRPPRGRKCKKKKKLAVYDSHRDLRPLLSLPLVILKIPHQRHLVTEETRHGTRSAER